MSERLEAVVTWMPCDYENEAKLPASNEDVLFVLRRDDRGGEVVCMRSWL